MATDRNTLKNWFRTGLKPTQSQFWAWLDSFWHKDEKIPISSIEGIDTALENKAETTALDSKANVDAMGLGDENIAKWKEALGVGEVPDNMATIDKDGEQGNAYTKEQVDDFLENSGKNLGNSDLETTSNRTFTQAHNYTHNTAGYYYYITGLATKSLDTTFNQMLVQDANGQTAVSNGKPVLENLMANLPSVKNANTGYDASFSEYLVYNPTTGQIKKSDKPQIVSNFNVPEKLTVTLQSNISNIQFTPKPEYSQDLIDALGFIKGIGELNFTKFRSDEMIFHYIQDEDLPEAVRDDAVRKQRAQDLFVSHADGALTFKGTYGSAYPELYASDYVNKMTALNKKSIANVLLNKEMPEDKDWCISFEYNILRFENYLESSKQPNIKMEFLDKIIDRTTYDNVSNMVYGQIENYGHHIVLYGDGASKSIPKSDSCVWFVKKGNYLISLMLNYLTGVYQMIVRNYQPSFRYLNIYLPKYTDGSSNVSTGTTNFTNIKYWIQS